MFRKRHGQADMMVLEKERERERESERGRHELISSEVLLASAFNQIVLTLQADLTLKDILISRFPPDV